MNCQQQKTNIMTALKSFRSIGKLLKNFKLICIHLLTYLTPLNKFKSYQIVSDLKVSERLKIWLRGVSIHVKQISQPRYSGCQRKDKQERSANIETYIQTM